MSVTIPQSREVCPEGVPRVPRRAPECQERARGTAGPTGAPGGTRPGPAARASQECHEQGPGQSGLRRTRGQHTTGNIPRWRGVRALSRSPGRPPREGGAARAPVGAVPTPSPAAEPLFTPNSSPAVVIRLKVTGHPLPGSPKHCFYATFSRLSLDTRRVRCHSTAARLFRRVTFKGKLDPLAYEARNGINTKGFTHSLSQIRTKMASRRMRRGGISRSPYGTGAWLLGQRVPERWGLI